LESIVVIEIETKRGDMIQVIILDNSKIVRVRWCSVLGRYNVIVSSDGN
jgi:hypothetical protein